MQNSKKGYPRRNCNKEIRKPIGKRVYKDRFIPKLKFEAVVTLYNNYTGTIHNLTLFNDYTSYGMKVQLIDRHIIIFFLYNKTLLEMLSSSRFQWLLGWANIENSGKLGA